MHIKYESFVREPLVDGDKTYHQVSEDIISPIEGKPGRMWYVGFVFSLLLLGYGIFSVTWAVYWGLGTWGVNRTIGWGWDITNFVDRYRSRGYADLCDPAVIPPGLAYRCEPCCRGHDDLCGNVRRPVPYIPHGSRMGWFLGIAFA